MEKYRDAYIELNESLKNQINEQVKLLGSYFLIEIDKLSHGANPANKISVESLTDAITRVNDLVRACHHNQVHEFELALKRIKLSQRKLKKHAWGRGVADRLLDLVNAILGTLDVVGTANGEIVITSLGDAINYVSNRPQLAETLNALVEDIRFEKPTLVH